MIWIRAQSKEITRDLIIELVIMDYLWVQGKAFILSWDEIFINQTTLTVWVNYPKTSNISRTLVGNEIVDHSDVVGASPVGAAPTSSSFST